MTRVRMRGAGSQAGSSLMEVLVAVVVAAVLVPALVIGLLTQFRVSGSTDGTIRAQTVAAGIVERMRLDPYVPCATPANLQSAYLALPGRALPVDTQLDVIEVEQWSRATNGFQAACEVVGAVPRDGGLQRVRIRVNAGGSSSIMQFVRRDQGARP